MPAVTWLLSAPVLVAGGFAVLAGAALGFAPWPRARWAALAPAAVGAALSTGRRWLCEIMCLVNT